MRPFSSTTLLIQHGTLVTPKDVLQADLLIQGERIKAIGSDLPIAEDTILLDAEGCYVLPGVIDAHTHIALDTGVYRTQDTWFTGTRAAACGGVTAVVDFATQFPGQTLRQAVEARLEEAREAVIDYTFHVMVTDLPPGHEEQLAVLNELGTPSVKLYTTYRPQYYATDATILRVFETCAHLGIRPIVHCENDSLVTARTEALVAAGQTGWAHHGQSRPALAEQEAIQRVLLLAEAATCPVHIAHCSTARSIEQVRAAQQNGQAVSSETCPQYLVLDNSAYTEAEPWRYILQPPLRDKQEPAKLWTRLGEGIIDLVASDHCDYTKEQKTAQDDFTQTPGGLPGLETMLPLLFTHGVHEGPLTLSQLAGLLAANPARIWGLWPRKGGLQEGADADVVIYDPRPERFVRAEDLHHVAGYTPYEGMRVQGEVKVTLSRGHVIYREGRVSDKRGRGRFVERPPTNT